MVNGLVADDGERQGWAAIRSGLGAGLQEPIDLDADRRPHREPNGRVTRRCPGATIGRESHGQLMAEHRAAVDDGELVRLARAGDRAAFARLLEYHRPLLLALCRQMLGDPDLAEDASQEAMLRALLSLDTLRRPQRFGPWLGGIGLNVCRRWRRERAHAAEAWSWEALVGGRRLEEPVDLDPQVAPERWAEERDLARAVQRAVDALPPGQRAAVLLAYLAGLSQAETASVLGVPLSAVKARLHKARAALRARLWTLSKEEEAKVTTAAETTTDYIDVHVLDVRQTREQPGRNIVLLEEVDGGRILPIWVGPFEGDSIVLLLEKVAPMRPPTFTFAARVLQAAGGTLREVRVSQLTSDSGTFYAEAVVEGPGGARVIDCRPSDAMSLALATDAPIRVAAAVMEAAAEPAERYVEVPEGTLTAADGAQRLRELEARAREEWTKAAQERAARRRAMPEGQGPAGSPAVAP